MKRATVVVPWREGLHLRPAARLVMLGRTFQSSISLQCGATIADLRSVLSIVALCATMGTSLEVEATGDDEHAAIQAVEAEFSPESRNA